MSATKRELERQEACTAAATKIAVRVGLLDACGICGGVKDNWAGNFEDAYKLGNSLISRGDELVDPFDYDRREMTDRIKALVGETPDFCRCDVMFAKDD